MRYIEVEFENKDNPGYADLEYSMAIKADHYPTFDEVEKFVHKDMVKLGYAKVYGFREITEDEVHNFFERCSLFADATAYMLDIVNGEQNDTWEKET